jgi:hypothetical protein
MDKIEKLAAAEVTADGRRSKYDAAWRAAWWATTLALGAFEATEKKQVGEAQAKVRDITGQSMIYIRRRTATGRGFDIVGDTERVQTLPPVMALEVVAAKVEITPGLVTAMLKADKAGIGYREFVTGLTGKPSSDTPAGASATTIDKIVQSQPEAVAKAVAKSPKVLHQATMEALYIKHGKMKPKPKGGADDGGGNGGLKAAVALDKLFFYHTDITDLLARMTDFVASKHAVLADYHVSELLEWIKSTRAALDTLETLLLHGEVSDDELAKLLGGAS